MSSLLLLLKYIDGAFCYNKLSQNTKKNSTGFCLDKKLVSADFLKFNDNTVESLIKDARTKMKHKITVDENKINELVLVLCLFAIEEELTEGEFRKILSITEKLLSELLKPYQAFGPTTRQMTFEQFLTYFTEIKLKGGLFFLSLSKILSWKQSKPALFLRIGQYLLQPKQAYKLNKAIIFLGVLSTSWNSFELSKFCNMYSAESLNAILQTKTSIMLENLKNDIILFSKNKRQVDIPFSIDIDYDAFSRILQAKVMRCKQCQDIVNVLEMLLLYLPYATK